MADLEGHGYVNLWVWSSYGGDSRNSGEMGEESVGDIIRDLVVLTYVAGPDELACELLIAKVAWKGRAV